MFFQRNSHNTPTWRASEVSVLVGWSPDTQHLSWPPYFISARLHIGFSISATIPWTPHLLLPLQTGTCPWNATWCLVTYTPWAHSKGVCYPIIQDLVATPGSRHYPIRLWGMRESWGKRKNAKVRGPKTYEAWDNSRLPKSTEGFNIFKTMIMSFVYWWSTSLP